MTQLHVGQKVWIKKYLSKEERKIPPHFLSDMDKYLGECVTVRCILPSGYFEIEKGIGHQLHRHFNVKWTTLNNYVDMLEKLL